MQICSGCKREFEDAESGVCPHCGRAVGVPDAAEDDPQPQTDVRKPEENDVPPAGEESEKRQPEPDEDASDSPDERPKRLPIKIIVALVVAVVVVIVVALAVTHRSSVPQAETSTLPAASETTAERAATQASAAEDAATETATEESSVLTDKAEILKRYNDATAKVLSAKVVFSKKRETTEGSFKADVTLKTLKDVIFTFMGIGADNAYSRSVEKNDVGYERYYMQASALTEDDIDDAVCKVDPDGGCTITLRVKDGGSYTDGGSGEKYSAPLDKSGVSAGDGDKEYWDHKTAQNIYAALSDVTEDAVVDEKYSDASVTAVMDRNGNLTKLDVTFDIDVTIDKVYGRSAHVTGSTTVGFSDFKW